MDKDNKELLEATCKGLEDKIGALNLELKNKQQELQDANKPVISSTTMDIINDTINKVVEDYEFDCGHFEYEFNLGYDNKLELSDLTFTDAYELVEAIVTKVEKQFKIEQDEETNE
jgi:GTP cyclohydrolase III